VLNITRWKPDTCECLIEYEWDDSVPADQRVHNYKHIIKCEAHKNEADDKVAFDKVNDENKTKNRVLGHILDNFPALVDTVVDEAGGESKVLKPGLKYDWSFDNQRKLQIDVIGVAPAQKAAIVNSVKSVFADKIK
jgi:hypothetical protein